MVTEGFDWFRFEDDGNMAKIGPTCPDEPKKTLQRTHFCTSVPMKLSAGRYILAVGINTALAEINRLPTTRTGMGSIELIGKNFFFLAAIRAFTDKRTQVAQCLESRAVPRGARYLWHV